MIALVWNAPVRLVDSSIRLEVYVDGLRQLGIESLAVCPSGMEEGYPHPVRAVADRREWADPVFWRGLGCDAACIVTWHGMTDLLMGARSAGLRTLAIGESDGQLSPLFHPWPSFRFATYPRPTLRTKIGAAKFWLERLLGSAAQHRALAANARAADVLTLAGQGAADEFARLLRRIGAGHLAEQIAVLPYPVPAAFCRGSVQADRPNRVIAVGRWDAAQKNAPLLASTVRRLAAGGSDTEVWIVGKDAEQRFSGLARECRAVRPLGVIPRAEVRELMAGCRAVLIPSRWESGPIVASEMLALGGTVVGTPIPNLRVLTADGRFGCVSASHRAGALASAVQGEMAAWERGERDAEAIAAHWRPLVSPDGVARRMLDLLGPHRMARQPVA